MASRPKTGKSGDWARILKEEPNRLVVYAAAERRTAGRILLVMGLVMVVVLGVLIWFHWDRWSQDPWLFFPLGLLVAFQLSLPLFFLLRKKDTRFELDARRIRRGRQEIFFDDVAALYLSTPSGREDSGRSRPGRCWLGLLLRQSGSVPGQTIDRLHKALESASREERRLLAEKMQEAWTQLEAEWFPIADTGNPALLWQVAVRLAEELGVVVLRLDAEPVALLPSELRLSLQAQLARGLVSVEPPGDPPPGVVETAGDQGPVIRWKRPKKGTLTQMAINLFPLLLLALLAFSRGLEMQWKDMLPYLIAFGALVPLLLVVVLIRVQLEVTPSVVRYQARFLVEKTQEMPLDELMWIPYEPAQSSVLRLVGTARTIELPMPPQTARWVRRRLSSYLKSGG